MSDAYSMLIEKVHPLHDLRVVADLLRWDREVNMPKAGDPARIQQVTILRQLIHQRGGLLSCGQQGPAVPGPRRG